MTDDVKSPFLKRTFHGNDENAKIGAAFKCNAIEETKVANLAFKGDYLTGYDFQNTYEVEEAPDGKDVAHQSLIEFMKIINDFNPANASDNDLKKLSEVWDYSHFLRAMALEFLAGSWDTFWWAGSNYYLYKPPGKPWVYIPTDFDFTFGSDYPNLDMGTYQEFSQGTSRPPIDKLLAVPKIKKDFEEMLKNMTNHGFNSDVLNPRIDGYLDMLKDELSWDRELTRLAVGKNPKWTLQNAIDNIVKPIPTKEFALKPWIADKVKLLQTQLNYKQKTEKYVPKPVTNSTSTTTQGSEKNNNEVHKEGVDTPQSSSNQLVNSVLLLVLSLTITCI
ncbi:hypothetical protein K7432_013583 [Basidiobolus ranarum]|uniref:Coth-domain-containing protein n=1 Tax=Basidiobolus ranarum TaxID=34480 RepID=A0ABR2VRB3_9FUNG